MASLKQDVEWLLKYRLIDSSRLLDDDLTIRDVSRRNRNTIFEWSDGTGFILKEARERDRLTSLENEAMQTKRVAAWADSLQGIRFRVPKVVFHASLESRLVLELVPKARSLRNVVGDRPAVPARLAQRIGRALRELHNDGPPLEIPEKRHVSWMLGLVTPSTEQYAALSSASRSLLAALQSSRALCNAIQELAAGQSGGLLVHGDIRWDNILLASTGSTTQQLWLIDWELAHWGHPLFDAAGFVADCLWRWLSFVATPRHLADSPVPDKPLHTLQACFRAFWSAYSNLPKEWDFDRLIELTRFCAMKLVQAGYERTQFADHFDRRLVLLLQLAENMLLKPETAVRLLCGDRRG